MLKVFGTIVRGAVAEAEEAIFDANSIRVLGQQLREAAVALEHSKKELACAMAYYAAEQRAVEALDARIAQLEASAVSAMAGGRDDLAIEAAATIAAAEDDSRTRRQAMMKFQNDIDRLKQLVEHGRTRLNALRRGLEMARVQEALHRAGANSRRAEISGTGALREAEATLARIQQRQTSEQDVHAALDDLDREAAGRTLDDRLAGAGFGASPKTSVKDVLARLELKSAAVASQSAASPAGPPPNPETSQ